ncbi:MAG: transposase [Candidatus Symbiothrix sp.]|jgi:hypothetical protein|nr:transposase [Candidatus Symbiothrix sp.]
MFRKSSLTQQLEIFSSPSSILSEKSLRYYCDSHSWHNIFYKEVLMRIDESIFSPLFCENNGAPNASVRLLVGMMVLKEGFGWSDAQLFEEARYNLLVRSALGMKDLNDPVPAESTYYLLRKRIVDREKSENENLLEQTFASVTKGQVIDFDVRGKRIRMDSKLIGSNIAWYSRYEIIHETLKRAYTKHSFATDMLSENELQFLESIASEEGEKVIYRHTKEEVSSRIGILGTLIYKILTITGATENKDMQLLQRVFDDQYTVEKNEEGVEGKESVEGVEVKEEVIPRPKASISSKSVQSPHDTECHYRNKDDNKVKGYSDNLTETCDSENKVNLIVNTQVEVVTHSDSDFLQPAVEKSQEILTDKIEKIHADGAYHSPENQKFCGDNIALILSAIQGAQSQFDLFYSDDEVGIKVVDTQTGENMNVRKIVARKDGGIRWVIKTAAGKYRYFIKENVETSLLRRSIAQIPQSELNMRNNVEATIFQLGQRYPNSKTRYRGLIKHKMWSNMRCLWVNYVRISRYISGLSPKTAFLTLFNAFDDILQDIGREIYQILIRNVRPQKFLPPQKFLLCFFD